MMLTSVRVMAGPPRGCTATLCTSGGGGIGIQTPTCSVVVRNEDGGLRSAAPRGITSTGQLEWATRYDEVVPSSTTWFGP